MKDKAKEAFRLFIISICNDFDNISFIFGLWLCEFSEILLLRLGR